MKRADAVQEKDGEEKNDRHLENFFLSVIDSSTSTKEDHWRMLDAYDSEFRWVLQVLHSLFIMYTNYFWMINIWYENSLMSIVVIAQSVRLLYVSWRMVGASV